MPPSGSAQRFPPQVQSLDANIIINALRSSVLVVNNLGVIVYVNSAAEQLFATSAQYLIGTALQSCLPPDSPIISLVLQSSERGLNVCEHAVVVDTPKTGRRVVSVYASTVTETPGYVVINLIEQSVAARMSAMLPSRNAAKSAGTMAAMLAHEVKNPLSGIRGAAQLLETGLPEEERMLSRLIIDETDRIVALVDRMEVFAFEQPINTEILNIHTVLDHVIRIAENGFARHARIRKEFDPSLPPVNADRNLLIQVFLNLIKNAAEAVAQEGGDILVSTAYLHGMRRITPMAGGKSRNLPLAVSIQDNGSGVPEDLVPHLFDAFVTTKNSGSGLGLALAAKIIDDHGGIIECESQPRRTLFRVLFPLAPDGAESQ